MAAGTSVALSTGVATTAHPFVASQQRRRPGRRLRADLVERISLLGLVNAATTPLIYVQAIPLVLLDLFVTAYQWICFPIYGVERVRRRRYSLLDRHRLPYLNAIEKLNCTYCAYANGVIAYTREVTARTEAYWCPIKHRSRVRDPHGLYEDFFEFGDARGYRRGLGTVRKSLGRPPRRLKPEGLAGGEAGQVSGYWSG